MNIQEQIEKNIEFWQKEFKLSIKKKPTFSEDISTEAFPIITYFPLGQLSATNIVKKVMSRFRISSFANIDQVLLYCRGPNNQIRPPEGYWALHQSGIKHSPQNSRMKHSSIVMGNYDKAYFTVYEILTYYMFCRFTEGLVENSFDSQVLLASFEDRNYGITCKQLYDGRLFFNTQYIKAGDNDNMGGKSIIILH